jgi:hypothetical protein
MSALSYRPKETLRQAERGFPSSFSRASGLVIHAYLVRRETLPTQGSVERWRPGKIDGANRFRLKPPATFEPAGLNSKGVHISVNAGRMGACATKRDEAELDQPRAWQAIHASRIGRARVGRPKRLPHNWREPSGKVETQGAGLQPGLAAPQRALCGGFEVALGHLGFFAEGAAPAGTRFVLLADRHQCVAQVQ